MHPRHLTVIFSIICATPLSTGGCTFKQTSPETQPSGPAVHAKQFEALSTPYIYSSYLKPERLNDAQRSEINIALGKGGNNLGEMWFVYVHYSRDGTHRVSAYFRPTEFQSGIRRGQAVYIKTDMSQGVLQRKVGGPGWPTPRPYVQIGTQDSDQGTTPSESDLPFAAPIGFSDDEIIKVIDAARSAAIKKNGSVVQMPVRNIELGEGDNVCVYFGWQAYRLSGRGVFVELKRNGAEFVEPAVGTWRS